MFQTSFSVLIKFVFVIFAAFAGSRAQASVFLPDVVSLSNYRPGQVLCDPASDLVRTENGFFVPVPVDYTNPAKGSTSVYVHLDSEFKSEQPSALFFDGGPGVPSHWHFIRELPGWNIIRFDQRGVACSRPQSYQTYRDVTFYSSENTAKDADLIRKFLKVKSWAVFANSYGTVPATIFASWFAANTISLTLEGVVYSGSEDLWAGPQRRQLLQQVLSSLPPETLTKVNLLASENLLPEYWFSAFGRMQMINNHGLETFKEGMLNFAAVKRGIIAQFRDALKGRPDAVTRDEILNVEDSMVFAAISCTELALASPRTRVFEALKEGRLIPSSEVLTSSTVCAPLGISYDPTKLYQSAQYPVKVPTTYFQGAEDGETDSAFATEHFKHTRTGAGQLMILRHGGHTPNQEILTGSDLQRNLQLEFFLKALRGEGIERSEVEKFNQSGSEHWFFTNSL